MPGGYLLVVKSDENAILRMPINDPADYSRVEIPTELNNPDGITLANPVTLLVVNNDGGGPNGNVTTLISNDRWQTTTVVNVSPHSNVFPTTAALVPGNRGFVLYAYLHILMSGGSQADYRIVEIE